MQIRLIVFAIVILSLFLTSFAFADTRSSEYSISSTDSNLIKCPPGLTVSNIVIPDTNTLYVHPDGIKSSLRVDYIRPITKPPVASEIVVICGDKPISVLLIPDKISGQVIELHQ